MAHKGIARKINLTVRARFINRGVVKLNIKTGFKAKIRVKSRDFIAISDLHRLLDADETAQCVLLDHARRGNQVDKTGGTAVHDGNFGRIDLHNHIVHTQTRQGRHQVLNRQNACRQIAWIGQGGRHARINHILRGGGDV